MELAHNQLLEVIPNDVFEGNCKPGDRARYKPEFYQPLYHTPDKDKYIPVKWLGGIAQNNGMYHRDMFKVIIERPCGNCEKQLEDLGNNDYLCADCRD